MMCLLQLINLCWHIIITQRPYFTLEFILSDVHSVDLDNCMATYIHHSSIIQSIFTALKLIYAPPSPLYSWKLDLLTVYVLFVFSTVSYSWIYIVCTHSDWLFLNLVIYIQIFSIYFRELIVCFFRALNNISLYGCTMVYLSISYWRTSWLM